MVKLKKTIPIIRQICHGLLGTTDENLLHPQVANKLKSITEFTFIKCTGRPTRQLRKYAVEF